MGYADNSPEFVSEIILNICKILKIDKSVYSPEYSQMNGGLKKRIGLFMKRHNVDKHI